MKYYVSDDFLNELERLTDENRHPEAYSLVAQWCVENCPQSAGRDLAVRFRYYLDYFDNYVIFTERARENPFWEVNYDMGKLLDGDIVRVFGADVLRRINTAR